MARLREAQRGGPAQALGRQQRLFSRGLGVVEAVHHQRRNVACHRVMETREGQRRRDVGAELVECVIHVRGLGQEPELQPVDHGLHPLPRVEGQVFGAGDDHQVEDVDDGLVAAARLCRHGGKDLRHVAVGQLVQQRQRGVDVGGWQVVDNQRPKLRAAGCLTGQPGVGARKAQHLFLRAGGDHCIGHRLVQP